MDGRLDADPATLEQVANRLRAAAGDLDATPLPPPAPEAGPCTAALAAVLGWLAESAAGVSEGVGAAGDAVVRSRELYARLDRDEADSLRLADD